MDNDLMNTNIAEKIADIFQLYTEIILCEKNGYYVSLQLIASQKGLYCFLIAPNMQNRECVIDINFENAARYEETIFDLRGLEKKLERILKEIRK